MCNNTLTIYAFNAHPNITNLSKQYQDIHSNMNFIFFDISFDILVDNVQTSKSYHFPHLLLCHYLLGRKPRTVNSH